jgi:hypothetical protein
MDGRSEENLEVMAQENNAWMVGYRKEVRNP